MFTVVSFKFGRHPHGRGLPPPTPEKIKVRRFGKSRSGNRKITRFAEKQLLIHGVIKALRLGFNVVLVNLRVPRARRSMRRL
jgi:hypothetical protein